MQLVREKNGAIGSEMSRLFGIIVGACIGCSASAHALVFEWSWTATGAIGPYPVGTTVSGTISGLTDNTNDQTAVAIVVNTPGGPITGWSYVDSHGFNVADGVITDGEALFFAPTGYRLYFGNSVTQYYPEFVNPLLGVGSFDLDNKAENVISYSLVQSANEPSALAVFGVGLLSLGLYRRWSGRSDSVC